jgi:pimeloyl-ACP methyl ester carboxylesterase
MSKANMKIPFFYWALPVVLAMAACSNDRENRLASLELKPCRVAHIENEVRCATLSVFEDRETRAGRKIPLNIVVLPATARIKEPDPIFVFAGGPGQAAADLGREALAMLGGLNNHRDIVLIDQRGTGKSNGLMCKMPDLLDVPSRPDERDAVARKALESCRDKLADHANLTLYTTTIAVADIDEAREQLGYRQINLWGGSYGTRSAMEYLRRYPSAVRSVVIDGVAPPSLAMPISFSRDAALTYDKMLLACEKEPACSKRFPALRIQVDELLGRLAKSSQKSRIADPLTGKVRELEVGREMVLMAIFSTLYVPEMAAMLPSTLADASAGNFGPLLAQAALFGDFAEDKMAFGMRLSVVCAEDIPRLEKSAIDVEAKRAPFGRFFIDEFQKGCDVWPRGKMAADFDRPVVSDRPVLILSGGLDPVTPPVFGDEVRKTLSNSRHLVAPNIGHGVAVRGCAPRLIKKFIESANVTGIDADCLARIPRPTFYQPISEKAGDRK